MGSSSKVHTFKHSGRLGDIVYALPAIRALGGGRLLLDPDAVPGFSKNEAAAVLPLLETQSYLAGVAVRRGETADYDLDRFRKVGTSHGNLVRAHLTAVGLDPSAYEGPWIETDELGEAEAFEVVLARSCRRPDIPGFWQRVCELVGREAVFVGTRKEHGEFESRFGPIPFAATNDLKELAALIHRCRLFIGNQSCPYAIAEGLGKPAVLEVDASCPNCRFHRPGATHVLGAGELWKIDEAVRAMERSCEPGWEILGSSPLAAQRARHWSELAAFDQFELKIGAREPITVRAGDACADGSDSSAPIELPTIEPFTVRAVLLESLYRVVEEPEKAGVICAEPIPPLVDTRTAGALGPAQSGGCSVAVLTYNSERTIEECLMRVLASLGQEDELIVVDNASSDRTASIVSELAKTHRFTLIANEENLGYSAGANVGLKASRGRYLALLNPDAFAGPDWINALTSRFVDPLVGAVGPVSNRVAGMQFVAAHLPDGTPPGLSEAELDRALRINAGRSLLTRLLIGFCVVFRRSVLDKVGLMDEGLFLGSDDLEMSLRLRSHGLRLAIARDVLVWHQGGASFASLEPTDKDRLLEQSSLALRDKIRALFAPGPAPSSAMLWDSDIFTHMLAGPDA